MDTADKYMVCVRCFTYNHSDYIEDALSGFAMQETSFPVVFLIVDDASTDGEQLILQRWAEEYIDAINDSSPIEEKSFGRLIVGTLKNKPNSTFVIILLAENHYQIKKSKQMYLAPWTEASKYYAICEGDDFWTSPNKLQKQVEFMESHSEFSLCFHNAMVMYGDTDNKSRLFCPIEVSREICLEEIVRAWIIPTASVLFKRDILPLPKWPVGIVSGDMKLELTAADRGKLYYFNDVMSCYRITYNTSSTTSRFKDKGEYMSFQKYRLLDAFNKNTSFRHEKILRKYINYWEKYSRFYSLKKKNAIMPFLVMPLFTLKKIYWNIFNNQPFA